MTDGVLEARNRLGAVVRLGGDVQAARASLEVEKAKRALRAAVKAGPSAEELDELREILEER